MPRAQKGKAHPQSSPSASRKSTIRPPRPVRPDDGYAFLPDLRDGPMRASDLLAETLAEEFIQSATSAEEAGEQYRDEVFPEEYGGPFVVATARQEMAFDEDAANPRDATREPFPTANRVPRG